MIKLVEINKEYAKQIEEFKEEILNSNDGYDSFAGCLGLEESKTGLEWVEKCINRKNLPIDNKEGRVPSTVYLAINDNNRLVGIIDLRHHINHPILGTWGGHCGYSVRPSEREKGYAKEMLRLNLANARLMGIDNLLVTCSEVNSASERVIRSNGGVYESMVNVDGIRIKRFWIKL